MNSKDKLSFNEVKSLLLELEKDLDSFRIACYGESIYWQDKENKIIEKVNSPDFGGDRLDEIRKSINCKTNSFSEYGKSTAYSTALGLLRDIIKEL